MTAQLRRGRAHGRRARRGRAHRRHDGPHVRASSSSSSSRKLIPDDPDEPADPRWTGRAVGARHDQRVRPAPRVGDARTSSTSSAPTSPTRRARDRPRRRSRSPSSTSTTSTTGPSGSSSASCCARRSSAKEASGVGQAAAVRRARRAQQVRAARLARARSRRSCSTSPSAAAASGIILIGAQQTASEVERRVVANCAIRVVGRLDCGRGRPRPVRLPARGAAPARRRSSSRARCIVLQPRLPVPVLVEFPFPAWATRSAEADPTRRSRRRPTPPADPFAGLTEAAMKLLHTSDWHVGKQIRGQQPRPTSTAPCSHEIAAHRRGARGRRRGRRRRPVRHRRAAARVAEHRLRRAAAASRARAPRSSVIAGNHDNAARLRAVAPLFERSGVRVVAEPTRPDGGGAHRFTARDGTPVRLAMLPFVSKRGIVRAEQLMSGAGVRARAGLRRTAAQLIATLCDGVHRRRGQRARRARLRARRQRGWRRACRPPRRGVRGQRASRSRPAAGYVALGHLHRPRAIAGATASTTAARRCNSTSARSSSAKQVNLVELQPGGRPRSRPLPLTAGRRLRTFTGTVDELAAAVAGRRCVAAAGRPRAAACRPRRQRCASGSAIGRSTCGSSPCTTRPPHDRVRRLGRTPHELFAEYLAVRGHRRPRIDALFAELLERDATRSST